MTKEFEKPSFNPSGKINKKNHRQILVFLRFLTSPSKQREAQDSKTSSIGDSEAIVQGVCSNYDLTGIEIKALSYIGDCIKKQLKLHLMARIKPQTLLQQSKKKKGPTRISVTTIILCNLIVVLIVLSLVATYRHWSQSRSSDQGRTRLSTLEDTYAFVDSKKYGYAIINTSKGYITVELYKDGSPETVDKFLDLCQKGHFKGMPFHHVIKNYVIQGGNSKGHGAAEDWTSKVKPHSQSPKHEAFMLGTPKTKPDGKEFELFITTAPIPDLNDKLIVFGRVIKGEDVVQEIEEVDTDEHYRPKSPIGIINVTLKRDI